MSNSPNKGEDSKFLPNLRHFADNHSQTSSCSLSSLYERTEISIESINQSVSTIEMYVKTNLNYGMSIMPRQQAYVATITTVCYCGN